VRRWVRDLDPGSGRATDSGPETGSGPAMDRDLDPGSGPAMGSGPGSGLATGSGPGSGLATGSGPETGWETGSGPETALETGSDSALGSGWERATAAARGAELAHRWGGARESCPDPVPGGRCCRGESRWGPPCFHCRYRWDFLVGRQGGGCW
jgi:hypothetical protein